MARGSTPANVVFICLAIGAAGAAAFAFYRTLWPLASAEESRPPEMVGGRTRAALEREKALVLKAIKELEFDRAMGKVSEKDFAEMSARLRARAARLMRQLDAGVGYRDEIEREVAKRIGAVPQAAAEPIAEAAEVVAPSAKPAAFCTSCGAPRGPADRFCAQCGKALEARA